MFLFGGVVAGTFMRDMTNTTEATAIYADLDFDLGNGWGLTIGGRYTDDERAVDVEQFIDLNGVPWTSENKRKLHGSEVLGYQLLQLVLHLIMQL